MRIQTAQEIEKDEKPIFEAVLSYIKRLARVEEIKFVDEKTKTQTSNVVKSMLSQQTIQKLRFMLFQQMKKWL